MLGTLGVPLTPLSFDVQNRTIRPIPRQEGVGSDMPGGGGGRGLVDGRE